MGAEIFSPATEHIRHLLACAALVVNEKIHNREYGSLIMRYFNGFLAPVFLLVALPLGAQEFVPETLVAGDKLERYWVENLSGGPPKDGIPSIDRPRFQSAKNADTWLEDSDQIIGLYHKGQARAYPQRVLVWHELVNDRLQDDGIAISYCLLTGTALGFKWGENEFGVSGRLINSNLIMYDRDSDSYWPQILGTAVEGPKKGKSLAQVPLIWTSWGQWKQRYPETEVLSRRTGYGRNYRRDPYGSYGPKESYYAEGGPIFPTMHSNNRYLPKQEIYGFRTDREAVAIDQEALAQAGSLRHKGKGGQYLILWDKGLSTAWVYRSDSDEALPESKALADLHFTHQGPQSDALDGLERVPGFAAMWFAWYAFYPDTAVLDAP